MNGPRTLPFDGAGLAAAAAPAATALHRPDPRVGWGVLAALASNWKTLPWHWRLSDSFAATLALVVLVPGLLAFVFGYFAFRSRIKGVYFSIVAQALTYAAMLLFYRNETGFGGNNGFTDWSWR